MKYKKIPDIFGNKLSFILFFKNLVIVKNEEIIFFYYAEAFENLCEMSFQLATCQIALT